MRVLVGCEFSGRVRDAFLARGHDAVSCDLLETDVPGPHIQGDVLAILDYGWDLLIAFPPCTDLSVVGARYWPEKQADGRQQAAADFFMALYEAPIARVAVENPRGYMSTYFRRPDQEIHPWMFGEPFLKRTGLWLRNLPPLTPTDIVEPQRYWVDGGYRARKEIRPGYRNPAKRGLTFRGIAQAMADQWGRVEGGSINASL